LWDSHFSAIFEINPYICPSLTLFMDQKTKEFYLRLREELATTSNWPTIYLYKFIVPTDPSKINQVEDAFNNMGAVINTVQSKNGNFTSISVNVKMDNPDHVIEKYLEVSSVEGIISL
jgi:uncharacterized protein